MSHSRTFQPSEPGATGDGDRPARDAIVSGSSSCTMDARCIVLDTNVCLDLFVFDDQRCAALRRLLDERLLRAVTREDCRAEWRRVLRYPVLRLDETRCIALERQYDAAISLCPPVVTSASPAVLPRCRDPDDQKFLELSRDVRALALVTRDDALLTLRGRVQRAGLAFDIVAPDAVTPGWLRQAGLTPRQ